MTGFATPPTSTPPPEAGSFEGFRFRMEGVAERADVKAGIVFVEVHVATPLRICERRDLKGLYRRARRGELTEMTGVDDPYEPPAAPDLRLAHAPVSSWVDTVLAELAQRGVVAA